MSAIIDSALAVRVVIPRKNPRTQKIYHENKKVIARFGEKDFKTFKNIEQ